jgi:hypothetical protein
MQDNKISVSYAEDKAVIDYNIWNEMWFVRLGGMFLTF